MDGWDAEWQGPGSSGEVPFPATDILTLSLVVFSAASSISCVAMWKHSEIHTFLQSAFARIGLAVGTHPVKFALASSFVVMVCAGGIALQENEADAENLWVPPTAISLRHRRYAEMNWPGRAAPSQFVVVSDDGNLSANMLTPQNLQAHFRDFETLMRVSIDGSAIAKLNAGKEFESDIAGTWTYAGLGSTRRKCFLTASNDCAMRSVFAIFGYNQSVISALTLQEIRHVIHEWEQAPLNSLVPKLQIFKGFEVSDVLGGIKRDNLGHIISAEIIRWDLLSNQTQVRAILTAGAGVEFIDPVLTLWEAEAACTLGLVKTHLEKKDTVCPAPAGVKYFGTLRRSFNDEFGEAIQNDVRLITIAYVLIAIYLAANLGKRDVVHSMYTMSLASLITVGASLTVLYGIGGYIGLKTSAIDQNIPFLILGLGVDDGFVLTAEYFRHTIAAAGASVEKRISLTARTGGASVMITSLTDALAFFIGATTVLPGLSTFCLHAAIGVLACFLLQLTLFLPLLALNARRTDAGRLDVFCWLTSKTKHLPESPEGCCVCVPCCRKVEPPDGIFKRLLSACGRLAIKTIWGKLFTVIVFTCSLVFGFVGFQGLHKDFDFFWFFPQESYVLEYRALAQRYFLDGVAMDIYTNGVDMFERRTEMLEMSSYLRNQPFIVQGSITDWWAMFVHNRDFLYENSTLFWRDLWQWYHGTGGTGLQRNIQWRDRSCHVAHSDMELCGFTSGISNSRISATLIRLPDGKSRHQMLTKLRKDIQDIFHDASGELVFPFSIEFFFWEEYEIIDSELTRNLIILAGVLWTIICLMLPNLRLALIVTCTICASTFEVLGFTSLWGVTLNAVSAVYLLICVGISVDYFVHIAHAFRLSTGSSEEKALAALERIGPSVAHALLSTAIAVSVLAGTRTYVLKVFFKVLMLVTLIAGAYGIWLLPLLLAFLGGSDRDSEQTQTGEAAGGNKQESSQTAQ